MRGRLQLGVDGSADLLEVRMKKLLIGTSEPPDSRPKTLVIAPSRWKCAPDDLQVGWRITCVNGEPYDVMWGATKREKLNILVDELRAKHGDVNVLDLLSRDELRDRRYFEALNAEAT
jgi:hypothetical protein